MNTSQRDHEPETTDDGTTDHQTARLPICVTATLAEIDARVQRLLELRSGLSELWPRTSAEVVSVKEAITPERVAVVAPARARPTGCGGRRNGEGRDGSRHRALVNAGRLVDLVAGLKEPFGGQDLADAAGIGFKPAYQALWRWTQRKWLVRAGKGMFRKSKTFPKAADGNGQQPVAEKRLVIPGLDFEEQSVQEKLSKARVDLAAARADGKATLVRVLEDKIEKLQGKL